MGQYTHVECANNGYYYALLSSTLAPLIDPLILEFIGQYKYDE